jgi:hypothetical protein
MVNNIEQGLLELIAKDRIEIPISSMSGKLKRSKPKVACEIDFSDVSGDFSGERVYGCVVSEERRKARGLRAGVDLYCKQFPKHGKILNGMIEEERVSREKHLYFGLHEGRRISSAAYMSVMGELGFSETTAERLYPEIMGISYGLSRKRGNPERSILIG